MHYSTLFLAPALLSLLAASGPIPTSDFDRRAAAPTTSAPPPPSTAPYPTPTATPHTNTTAADTNYLYPEPTDDDEVWLPDDDVFIPGFEKRSATPHSFEDDDDVFIPNDDDFIPPFDKRSATTVADPHTFEDDDDDEDVVYLYGAEPEDSVAARETNGTAV
ncbi:MAG: hypothetical protein Q9195_009218 [Heterodermia aff. obscurata]